MARTGIHMAGTGLHVRGSAHFVQYSRIWIIKTRCDNPVNINLKVPQVHHHSNGDSWSARLELLSNVNIVMCVYMIKFLWHKALSEDDLNWPDLCPPWLYIIQMLDLLYVLQVASIHMQYIVYSESVELPKGSRTIIATCRGIKPIKIIWKLHSSIGQTESLIATTII